MNETCHINTVTAKSQHTKRQSCRNVLYFIHVEIVYKFDETKFTALLFYSASNCTLLRPFGCLLQGDSMSVLLYV